MTKSLMTRLRERLSQLYEDQEFDSFDEAEEIMGMDRMMIHKVMNLEGKPKYQPTLETLERFAEGVGASLPKLVIELYEGRLGDLIKPKRRKDLSEGAAKADNPESNGAALHNAADRLASEGVIVGAAEVIVEAIDRTSTAIGAIRTELQQFRTETTQRLERLAASAEQARKSRRR